MSGINGKRDGGGRKAGCGAESFEGGGGGGGGGGGVGGGEGATKIFFLQNEWALPITNFLCCANYNTRIN
jgi:hypothetical protein